VRTRNVARAGATVALAVALAACASTANYQKLMDSLKGTDVNEVLRSWGPPTQTVPMPNGNRLLVYDRGATYLTPVTVTPGQRVTTTTGDLRVSQATPTTVTGGEVIQAYCRTNIEVAPSGQIVSAQFTGNSCRARERDGKLEPAEP
jgi:hypothetical protein